MQLAAAQVGVERIWREVAQVALTPVPPLQALRASCGDDALCAGQLLAQHLGPRARLQRLKHPDTDSIRRVRVLPTITRITQPVPGIWQLRLERFGRKAVEEIGAALDRALKLGAREIRLDLRHNGGGDIHRMLRAAALFTGARQRAVQLHTKHGSRWLDIPASPTNPASRKHPPLHALPRHKRPALVVLIGPRTASSAEVFAALLKRHAGARLKGRASRGKNWLSAAITINHDWRLLVPAAIIEVPGVNLQGGLRPDLPPVLP